MLTIRHCRQPAAAFPTMIATTVTFTGYSLQSFRKHVSFPRPVDPTVAQIQKLVADYYGISLRDILSPRRQRSIARPRQVAMYLAQRHTKLSLVGIGRRFGRDHTTVLHAVRQIDRLKVEDDHIAVALAELSRGFPA